MLLRDLGDVLESGRGLSRMLLGVFGEGLGGLLGSSWEPLGLLLGPLGRVWGASWGDVGASWSGLGASWGGLVGYVAAS